MKATSALSIDEATISLPAASVPLVLQRFRLLPVTKAALNSFDCSARPSRSYRFLHVSAAHPPASLAHATAPTTSHDSPTLRFIRPAPPFSDMSSSPAVVLFAYPQSPYAAKLELCLLLKGIQYSYCTVSRIPPRPALQALGVTYRRIPVLCIGNDLIFDTALAIVALEEAFPESKSLAGRSWALQQASSFFWSDRTVFPLVSSMLPWDALVSFE